MTDLTVAYTIRDQINMMDRFAFGAWGAKEFIGMEDGLMFKTSGMVKFKGKIVIKLNSRDLYDVTAGQVRKSEWKVRKEVKDVYFEDLIEVLDDIIG